MLDSCVCRVGVQLVIWQQSIHWMSKSIYNMWGQEGRSYCVFSFSNDYILHFLVSMVSILISLEHTVFLLDMKFNLRKPTMLFSTVYMWSICSPVPVCHEEPVGSILRPASLLSLGRAGLDARHVSVPAVHSENAHNPSQVPWAHWAGPSFSSFPLASHAFWQVALMTLSQNSAQIYTQDVIVCIYQKQLTYNKNNILFVLL